MDRGGYETVTNNDWDRFMYIILVMMLSGRNTFKEYWSENPIFTNVAIKGTMPRNLFE